jgi:hypothetical protein
MEDDDKLTLRDKFAIEIYSQLIDGKTLRDFILKPETDINTLSFKGSRRLIQASYKLADIMRKVRLGAFE